MYRVIARIPPSHPRLSNESIVRARSLTLANSEGELAKVRLLALSDGSLLRCSGCQGVCANPHATHPSHPRLRNESIVRARSLILANSPSELAKVRFLALTIDPLLSLSGYLFRPLSPPRLFSTHDDPSGSRACMWITRRPYSPFRVGNRRWQLDCQ